MRLNRILAPVALTVAFAGCVDEPLSTLNPGSARIVFASEFSYASSSAGLPIRVVRATSVIGSDTVGTATNRDIDPDDEQFEIDAVVDLGGRDSAFVDVEVELLSTASGREVVEWSGRIGPILVRADEETIEQSDVTLIRGPIANLDVQAIDVFGPPSMLLNATHPAFAEVITTGSSHQVVWSSSDGSVITIDHPVGDSIDIAAVGIGEAWIIGAAGMQADSFLVSVTTSSGGPVASVVALPDSATLVPGATRQWQAFALDQNEVPTFPTFTWTSLDQTIATVSSTGVVSALELGRARIVVSAEGFADTAIVNVQSLPPGVTILWQGGTPGAEEDWFTADNWSPARVPTASDVVYVPNGSSWLLLDGNAEIGGLVADSLGGYSFDMIGASTLTIHGDLLAPVIFGDSASFVVLDQPGSQMYGYVPNLRILGDVQLVNDVYSFGVVELSGAHVDVGSEYVLYAQGDLTATNASVTLSGNDSTFSEGAIYVAGDLLIDGGDWSTGITAGAIEVLGDFTVTAAVCGSFAPQGGEVELISDTATISIGCSGPSQNRFHDLWVWWNSTTTDRIVELASDVYVMNELYLDGFDRMHVVGNGHALQTRWGSAYNVTFDRTFVEIASVSPDDYFTADSITFTGMTGETRPQVRYFHPGEPCFGCYSEVEVQFDPTSSGPYLEVTDTEVNGDSIILYMVHNPGDGPARTVVSGEAVVHWADIPMHLLSWSGSGQTGTQNQPLPDSLVAQVVDYAFYGVEGIAVDWLVTQGGGSVSPALSTTDSAGLARTQWTIGDTMMFAQEAIATTQAVPADTAYYFATPTGTAPAGVLTYPAQADGAPRPVERNRPERRSEPDRLTLPAPPPARTDMPTTGGEPR